MRYFCQPTPQLRNKLSQTIKELQKLFNRTVSAESQRVKTYIYSGVAKRSTLGNLHTCAAQKAETKEKGPLRLVSATKKWYDSLFEMSHDQHSRDSRKLHS